MTSEYDNNMLFPCSTTLTLICFTALLSDRLILIMWPKLSPKRRWISSASPVSIWPKPKSTPWWRRTPTLVSWDPCLSRKTGCPAQTKTVPPADEWCERTSNGQKLTQEKGTGAKTNLCQDVSLSLWINVGDPRCHRSGSELMPDEREALRINWHFLRWKRCLSLERRLSCAYKKSCINSKMQTERNFTQQNYHEERCSLFDVLLTIYLIFIHWFFFFLLYDCLLCNGLLRLYKFKRKYVKNKCIECYC